MPAQPHEPKCSNGIPCDLREPTKPTHLPWLPTPSFRLCLSLNKCLNLGPVWHFSAICLARVVNFWKCYRPILSTRHINKSAWWDGGLHRQQQGVSGVEEGARNEQSAQCRRHDWFLAEKLGCLFFFLPPGLRRIATLSRRRLGQALLVIRSGCMKRASHVPAHCQSKGSYIVIVLSQAAPCCAAYYPHTCTPESLFWFGPSRMCDCTSIPLRAASLFLEVLFISDRTFLLSPQ